MSDYDNQYSQNIGPSTDTALLKPNETGLFSCDAGSTHRAVFFLTLPDTVNATAPTILHWRFIPMPNDGLNVLWQIRDAQDPENPVSLGTVIADLVSYEPGLCDVEFDLGNLNPEATKRLEICRCGDHPDDTSSCVVNIVCAYAKFTPV